MTNFYYRCFDCGKKYKQDEVRYLCKNCERKFHIGEPLRGVLEVVFDYDYIASNFHVNKPDWRLFSAVDPKYFPSYPVGNTPFFRVLRFDESLGYGNVWIKCDGLNPSGSLKDRASFLVVAESNRINENRIITASTGNAASALAAVAASAGKQAIIFVPKSAPIAKLVQIAQYGADIRLVDGSYDDAFRLSLEFTKDHGGLNRNTAYNPLTIEGKKTVGFEIFSQNGNKVPDVIIVPVGDGVIISGVYKAFRDLFQAKIIKKMPRLVCVQAEKSSAVHDYILSGKYKNAINPSTVADSISVAAPSNIYMASNAIKATRGFSVLVSDDEILLAQMTLAKTTGVFAEPAAAATLAGLEIISKQKLLPNDSQIVLLITGNGLKDIESARRMVADKLSI